MRVEAGSRGVFCIRFHLSLYFSLVFILISIYLSSFFYQSSKREKRFKIRELCSHQPSTRLELTLHLATTTLPLTLLSAMAPRSTPLSLLRGTSSRIAASPTSPSSSSARRSFSLLRSQSSFPSSSSASPSVLSSHRRNAKRTPIVLEAQKRTFVPYVIDEVRPIDLKQRGDENERRKEGDNEADGSPFFLLSLLWLGKRQGARGQTDLYSRLLKERVICMSEVRFTFPRPPFPTRTWKGREEDDRGRVELARSLFPSPSLELTVPLVPP